MKKFFEGGEVFVLSSYRINAVPVAEDSEVGVELAKTICEDACYLCTTRKCEKRAVLLSSFFGDSICPSVLMDVSKRKKLR